MFVANAVVAGVGGVTFGAMPATRTRRKGAARSRSRARSSAAKKRSATTRSSRTRAARAPRTTPSALARTRDAAGRQLAGHRADAVAVTLVVVGVLVGLGLWTDLGGPIGTATADALGAGFGRARVAIPILCVVFALLILWPKRGPPPHAADDDDAIAVDASSERATIRIAVGAVLLLVADLGILHLAGGRPAFDASTDALRDAGGYAGALVAAPLT